MDHWRIFLCCIGSCLALGTASETGAAVIPEGPLDPGALHDCAADVDVTYDRSAGVTWIRPQCEAWRFRETRLYPAIAQLDDGRRSLVLVQVLEGTQRSLKTVPPLRAEVDGTAIELEPGPADTTEIDASGCRPIATSVFVGQEPLVRAIAASAHAVTMRTATGRSRTLDDVERSQFLRIVALFDIPGIPAPPRPAEAPAPETIYEPPDAPTTCPIVLPRTKKVPRYPEVARGRGIQGKVILGALIQRDGTVGRIEVTSPIGGGCGFEAAAIDAVSQWRYRPATCHGEPVEVLFGIEVTFSLR